MDYDELIRQGKVKRIFRAKRKLTVPDIVSHITQRAAGKEPLFVEDSDYLYMLANMKHITKKRSLDVYVKKSAPQMNSTDDSGILRGPDSGIYASLRQAEKTD